MNIRTFKGYGVQSPDITIVLERVTYWYAIDYNGNYGTELHLDNGESIRIGEYHHTVEEAIKNIEKVKEK
jgi:uncharacterized protein YegP (UPF0339 family)